MEYQYQVVEQGRFEQTTYYSGSSFDAAMEEYSGLGAYSSGPLTLYRTDGKSWEWLCTDGKTFLPC